jgi:AsmA protein
MKKLLIGLGAVVAVAVAALVAIPLFVPVAAYKDKIAAEVRDATGRDFTIAGDVSLSLFPSAAVVVEKVTFGNAPWGSVKDMASLSRLKIEVRLLPLLAGEIAIDSFVLVDPTIVLEVDRQGRKNWEIGAPTARGGTVAKPASGGAKGGLADLTLGDIRIANGTVAYIDAKAGTREEIKNVNLTVALANLDSPLKAAGEFAWKGETVSLKLDVAAPRKLMEGAASGVKTSLSAKPVALAFDGTVANGPVLKVDGNVDLKVPSVRTLAAWTGNPVALKGQGLGPLAIKGKLGVDGPRLAFAGAEFELDQTKAKGDFAFDSTGTRPAIKAKLDVDKLDLNLYLGGEPAKPAPAVQAAAKKDEGWNDEPIDVSGFKAVDADVSLSLGGLQFQQIKIGKSAVAAALKNGRLSAALTELALYQGRGTGRIVVDASRAPAAIEAAFDLKDVQANPLLTDAVGFDRLEGGMGGTVQVSTAGASQRALIGALQGKGDLAFTNGAIRGINLGAMVRNVATAFTDPAARAAQKTDFAELSGTFTVTNGILKNTDLALLSPLLRVAGAGTVDLPKQAMNYRVEPKLAMTTEGQGGEQEAAGLTVPVIVEGPWSNLSFKPDLGAMVKDAIKDPAKAVEGVKGLLPGAAGGAGAAAGSAGGPAGGAKPDPLGAVKGLFGGKKN